LAVTVFSSQGSYVVGFYSPRWRLTAKQACEESALSRGHSQLLLNTGTGYALYFLYIVPLYR